VNQLARQPVYAFEGFRLDTQRRVLFGLDGDPIPLTPRVFDALLYFIERSGQLLTKEQLLEDLWPNVIVEEHNLNKTVSELRRVLGETPGEHRFIVTKPGRGYRFVAAVSTASSTAGEDTTLEARDADAIRHESDAAPAAPSQHTSARRYWAAAGAGAGALAVAAAMFGFFGVSPPPALRAIPWSTEKGQQWYPVWSPEGGATAFATFGNPNEPPALHIRALGEPIPRSIASRPGQLPAIAQWTSAGKLLFFEREGLWSVSPVGGPPELAVPLDYRRLGMLTPIRTAHVARDGSTLAMLARGEDGSVGIWTATPPGAMLERYVPAPFAADSYFNIPFLRFSPDGTRLLLIAYAAGRGNEAWLMPFPPDATNPPRRVLEGVPLGGEPAEFSWFPDNRHVVVSAGGLQERQLYVADTLSVNFRVLVTGLSSPNVPVVSPDGSKLVVTNPRIDYDIVTLELRTAAVKPLIATDRAEILPAWAADANALVYVTDRGGPWEIWLHQGSQPDQPLISAGDFPTATLYFIAPTLSPDGTRLIFHRVEAQRDRSRLWMSAVAGGTPEPLTNEELTERAGSWSPDGSWYAYLASPADGGPLALKKVRTTGQAVPETLLEDVRVVGANPVPIWSPDGQWILVAHEGLTLVSADGATSRNLVSEVMPCAFAETEPLLYCIRGSPLPVGEHALIVLDLEGNVVRTIDFLPAAYRPASPLGPGIRLSPTPDRLGVTFSVENVSQTLWLVEGLDRVPLP
jgi:DNA-binding winged helix-turn-helix (wHTH) protein/Tol biopolymer transport system component